MKFLNTSKNTTTAIKSVKDIQSGAIVTTAKGHEYVLLRDDSGNAAMFAKDGRFVRLDQDKLCDVKGKHEITKIGAFLTMPQADQISEALKYMYTGREACAVLTTIYEKENKEVKEATNRLNELTDKLKDIASEARDLLDVLTDNGVTFAENNELLSDLIADLEDDEDYDDDYDDDDYDEDWDD